MSLVRLGDKAPDFADKRSAPEQSLGVLPISL